MILIKCPVIYTSDSAHYSISKNANILGLGRESVCFVPTDENGKMITELLEEFILKDINQGKNPFLIVATSGTTVLGAFDEISKISKISKKYNLWLHVDGSYGLSVGFSQKRKHLIYGIENADSMTFNPHKSLGVTQQCSVLLLKEKGILEKTLSDEAPYLFQIDSEYNFGQKSPLCGRRNDAIKLWSLWKNLGDEGIADRVEKQFQSVYDMVNLINNNNKFKLEYQPDFLNICFNYKDISAMDICDYLYNNGLAKVSHGKFKEKTFIRYTCLNPNFTIRDHQNILDKIQKFR